MYTYYMYMYIFISYNMYMYVLLAITKLLSRNISCNIRCICCNTLIINYAYVFRCNVYIMYSHQTCRAV